MDNSNQMKTDNEILAKIQEIVEDVKEDLKDEEYRLICDYTKRQHEKRQLYEVTIVFNKIENNTSEMVEWTFLSFLKNCEEFTILSACEGDCIDNVKCPCYDLHQGNNRMQIYDTFLVEAIENINESIANYILKNKVNINGESVGIEQENLLARSRKILY